SNSFSAIYKAPKTNGWTLQNSQLLVFSINLTKGNNTIIIHGDGSNFAPNFSLLVLGSCNTSLSTNTSTIPSNTIPTNINILAIDGALSGNSKKDLNSKFLTYVGGPTDGSTIIAPTIPTSGLYSLSIQYVSADINRPLKIDIPTTNTSTIFNVPMSSGWNVTDAITFTIPVFLKSGITPIKLHGNGSDYAPNLGNISLSFVSVMGINMSCYTVPSTTCPTCANCLTLPIIAPITPPVTQTIPTIVIPTIPTYTYNVANGLFSGEASKDGGTSFAGYIGGPTDGSSTVGVNVATTTLYNLAVKYIGGDVNRPLKIDINGVNTGSIYTPQKTGGWTVNDALTFTVAISLNSGINTIKFHGDGTNY
ncbi:MAG: hypothetical protein ACRC7R_10585, partial [Sarcina sp.]